MADAEDEESEKTGNQKTTKPKAAKVLPTDRMKFEKQLDMLRAFVSASAARANAPVSVKEVAEVAGVPESAPSLLTAFFLDVGLLTRNEGKYAPSSDAIKYERAVAWGVPNPATKIAPSLRDQWFSTALVPRAGFRAIEEQEAIGILADAAAAPPERRRQVEALLEYMIASGLLVRGEGTLLRAGTPESPNEETPPPPLPASPPGASGPNPGPQAGTSKRVDLKSGGVLTISATLDLFSLSTTDRDFVFSLIDKLDQYERGQIAGAKKPAAEDVANVDTPDPRAE